MMLRLKKYCLMLLIALMAMPALAALPVGDDDDKDPSIRPGIRRLYPQRERAKAMKKLREQMSRKAEVKADPWDTSDELWGTVDLVPETPKDSAAIEGHRLNPYQSHTSKTPTEQSALDSLLSIDYSPVEYGYRRMTWRDLPVTKTVEQLLPGFVMTDEGDCMSRYISRDKISNEIYFTFAMQDSDSIPGPLRLCVQYCADDPLDYDQIIFTIDGFDYFFYPREPQREALSGGLYSERSDDVLNLAYRDLAYALAHSHWVAAKLVSTRGIHHVKMLNENQRSDFADTLDLYRLMGGTF